MKRFFSIALVLLLCFSLAGCNKTPGTAVDPPGDPDPPDVVTVELDWVVQPTFVYEDVQVLDLYYDDAVPQRTKYLAFKQDGRWGLVDLDLNIVVPAIGFDAPFFCPMGELHLSAAQEDLDALQIDADDIELAVGGHGGFFYQFVYDVNNSTMYILAGDAGYELYLPGEYPLDIPDVVPVAFIEQNYNDQYDWGLEITFKDTYGYCNSSGKLISTIEYEYACDFSDGVSAARRGGAWGYVDTSLNPITTFSYRGCTGSFYNTDGTFIPDFYPYYFLDGYAVVRAQNYKYGVVDKTGEEIIPCEFDSIVPVKGGRAAVKQDGKWGVVQLSD